MMEMEKESHGTVRIMRRQSQHKTTGQSLWRVPLSARSELHSQPLAEQAQACGRLTKAEGPEGPMAPIVTTGGYLLWVHTCDALVHALLFALGEGLQCHRTSSQRASVSVHT